MLDLIELLMTTSILYPESWAYFYAPSSLFLIDILNLIFMKTINVSDFTDPILLSNRLIQLLNNFAPKTTNFLFLLIEFSGLIGDGCRINNVSPAFVIIKDNGDNFYVYFPQNELPGESSTVIVYDDDFIKVTVHIKVFSEEDFEQLKKAHTLRDGSLSDFHEKKYKKPA